MLWAPKPMVAPTTVAPASSGVRLMPMVPEDDEEGDDADRPPRHMLATMAVMVTARAAARGESARPAARRATAPIQRRMIRLPNQPTSSATRRMSDHGDAA